jgi:two-component system CheB/CheR fusion protein
MQELFYTFSNIKHKRNKSGVELRYKFEIGTKDTLIKTDPVRFKQIMTNLIDNALKFTDRGYVEFGFRPVKSNSSDFVECFVRDSGIGISEDNQKVIFNRFRKIEDINNKFYDGTGLGLSISQKLAKLMGTEIILESKKGRGSSFSFTVPVAESNTVDYTVRRKIVSGSSPAWDGKKVLIADDELTSILLLKEYLIPTGIEVISATNGKVAVDLLENGLRPDLILMDLRMPVLDGYTATAAIKEKYPELKVIAQTAYVMPDDEDKARASGCDDFITKPISKEVLFEKLALYLG